MSPLLRTILMALPVMALGACATLQPSLEVPAPAFLTANRLPMTVAVSVPSASRDIDKFVELPTGCLGTIEMASAPIGETFAKVIESHLATVFERVVPASAAASGVDAVIEARMEAPGIRFGCPISPGSYISFKGEARALDANGREVWRAPMRERRQDTGVFFDIGSMNRGIGQDLSRMM
ncbi:MAG: hypothetical protein FJX47_17315, partial [Alphaproteobacteria bacterium]|nr:hypothetical protein [Alphaproteobacteria bacterium]